MSVQNRRPRYGFLDGGHEKDIKAMNEVSLPFWLIRALLAGEWIDFDIPTPYGQRVQRALKADTKNVKLAGLVGGTGLWYLFGRAIAEMLEDDQRNTLSKMLLDTFDMRLGDIYDQAVYFGAGSGTRGGQGSDASEEFRQGLEGTERQIKQRKQDREQESRAPSTIIKNTGWRDDPGLSISEKIAGIAEPASVSVSGCVDMTASSPILPPISELIDQSVNADEQASGPSNITTDSQTPTQPQAARTKLPIYHAIEYPGHISPNSTSINRAITTLGGQKCPDNPFAHPVTGDVVGTNTLLVKVVTRKKKQVARTSEIGDSESTVAGSSEDKGKGKERVDEESQGTYTAEVMGIIPKTVRFRSMADFQYQPNEDDYVVQMRRAMDRLDGRGKSQLHLIPPPLFSRQGIPQHYNLKQNPMSVIHSTVDPRTGEETRRYIHKHRIKGSLAPAAVSWDSETVPTSPPQQILDAKPQTKPHLLTKLKQLFEERPVWSRIALINQFPALEGREIQKCGVIFRFYEGIAEISDGAWRDTLLKFGYDPRKDPAARFYQRVYFRNTANEEARRKSIVGRRAGGAGDSTGPEVIDAPSDDRKSHIFDGRTLHSGAASFQLCDITDSLLVPLINDQKSVRKEPDIADGWYTSHEFNLIKAVVRRKHFNLLQGKIIEDKDCADLFVPGGLTSSNTMVRTVNKKYLRKAKSNRRPVAPERLMAAELEIALRKGGESVSGQGKEPTGVEESEEDEDAMEED
ncbi:RNA polymerase III transcription factor (TF)IIIC subunit [Rhizoctonia solani]|uniref:RNA polymerase III transcription factor (TF)IIIC subunit n=1 Tax=Rhizoctonia solani TaxID=456999 RepID=A0A8H7M547_9AGAM|nr:RNA polymerase III transcription factor (TF)IIIC subunit [Rhizoctonia solani]